MYYVLLELLELSDLGQTRGDKPLNLPNSLRCLITQQLSNEVLGNLIDKGRTDDATAFHRAHSCKGDQLAARQAQIGYRSSVRRWAAPPAGRRSGRATQPGSDLTTRLAHDQARTRYQRFTEMEPNCLRRTGTRGSPPRQTGAEDGASAKEGPRARPPGLKHLGRR